jgi:hypothetical protein
MSHSHPQSKTKILKGIEDEEHDDSVHSLIGVFNRHHQLRNSSHNHDIGNSPEWLQSIEKILSRTNSASTSGGTLFSSRSLPPLPPSQEDEDSVMGTFSESVSAETKDEQTFEPELIIEDKPPEPMVATNGFSTSQKKLLHVGGHQVELDQYSHEF